MLPCMLGQGKMGLGQKMNILYTSFRQIRIALAIMAVLLALSVPASAPAWAEDVFTVSGVKVDVTAENAVAAREKAFAEAQLVAFKALADRLLGAEEAKTFVLPDVATISTMIQDFEITDERLSAVEYIGTYTFRFDGDAVRNQFNMGGTKYSDVASKPVLALPFFQWGSRIIIWQDSNPWLKAWSRSEPQGGLVPIRVPLGDIRDIADIGDDQALTYRRDGMNEILGRYGAGEAIILIAVPGPADAAGVPTDLGVMIYRTDRDRPEYVQTLRINPDANSTADALYDKAVRETRAALQQEWKVETAVDPTIPTNNVTVRVQFSTMQQWVETRQALRRVQGITAMKVKTVTPREAQVELEFSGDENRLRLALEQQDMMLSAPEFEYAYGSSTLYNLSLKKYARY
ncbi:MAG: DUF2066 domain-containing protein [Micavibrio sp.]